MIKCYVLTARQSIHFRNSNSRYSLLSHTFTTILRFLHLIVFRVRRCPFRCAHYMPPNF
nr:MAG TPA: hypothetical protein [Caudoviricetes sp.]